MVLEDLNKEITIVSNIQHPHIVNVVGAGRELKNNEEILYILMENAEEGEIFDMVANTGKFSEPTARYFFKQIIDVVGFLHNQAGICHRDLKPENILLNKTFDIKVADFGFASPILRNGKDKLKSYKGTLGYMTPEQFAGLSYCGRQADLFAVGVVLFTMLTQCAPFTSATT